MRDPRILWPQQIFQTKVTAERSIAFDLTFFDDELVREWTANWWKNLVRSNPKFKYGSEISLPSFLPKNSQRKKEQGGLDGAGPLLKKINEWISRDGSPAALANVIGDYMVEVVVTDASIRMSEFDLAYQFFSEREKWIVFEEKLVKMISTLTKRERTRWIEYLQDYEDLSFSLLQFFRGEKEALHASMEQKKYSDTTQTFDLIWNTKNRSHLRVNDCVRARLRVLCGLDFQEFLRFFSRVPLVEVQGAVFNELFIEHDKQLVVEWIKNAPIAVDSKQRVISSDVLFGVHAIVDYARAVQHGVSYCAKQELRGMVNEDLVVRAKKELVHLESEELPQWFDDAFKIVLGRPDGIILLLDLTMELIHRAIYMTPENAKEVWNVERVAIEALARIASKYPELPATVRERYRFLQEEKNGRGRVSPGNLLLLLCLLIDQPALKEGSIVWEWYSEMLIQKDRSLLSHMNRFGTARDWVFDLIGASALNAERPATLVRATWEQLYLQRFFARFNQGEPAELDACRHLLRTALGALNGLLTQDERKSGIEQELWCSAANIARTLYLSHGGLRFSDDASLVHRVFCYLPAVFPSSWQAKIAEWADVFHGDPELCIRVAQALQNNRVSKEVILEEFADRGLFLEKGLAEVDAWYKAAGDLKRVPFDIDAIKKAFSKV